MPERRDITSSTHRRPNWRSYQARLQRSESAAKRRKVMIRLGTAVFFMFLAGFIIWNGQETIHRYWAGSSESEKSSAPPNQRKVLDRTTIQALLNSAPLINPTDPVVERAARGICYRIQTSLDQGLQQTLIDAMNPAHARYIAIVAMVPASGRIVAMASYDRLDPGRNPCYQCRFPAASVFKIVTAAAAMENCQMTMDAPTFYSGRKYTLYKSQLKKKKNRWSNQVSFREAFAESVNPVFGKIGQHCLGQENLSSYGEAFGFNQTFQTDLPLPPSQLAIGTDPYQWAEVACGFNRQTTVSPLHGAMMAAALINQGRMVSPRIVDSVQDDSGRLVYRGRTTPLDEMIRPETCESLSRMMQAVVDFGTCRKQFRGYQKDSVLKKLIIGGKTGSINNSDQDARFDWFVGFARDKTGNAALAVSALVAHEKYIGTRAARYARITMRAYFERLFALQASRPANDRPS